MINNRFDLSPIAFIETETITNGHGETFSVTVLTSTAYLLTVPTAFLLSPRWEVQAVEAYRVARLVRPTDSRLVRHLVVSFL